MAKMNRAVVTEKGFALMSKALVSGYEIPFTALRTSEKDYYSADIKKLTSLDEIKQTMPVSDVNILKDATIKVEGAVLNTDLTAGYWLRTLGLYATDPDDGEILFAVSVASEADFVPSFGGVVPSGVVVRIMVKVNDTSNISINVDAAAYVTVMMFEAVKADVENHTKDEDNPHNVTAKQVGAVSESGTAAKAKQLETPRNITLEGNTSGSVAFDGTADVTINTTVSYAAAAPWNGVTGKPTSYLPSAHTHTAAQVTAGTFPSGLFAVTRGAAAGGNACLQNNHVPNFGSTGVNYIIFYT